ncbi:MAG TPA: nucleoside triphosphate pyrophosphohydrolase [Ignavibacteria bacterium]|nr:nucleoside triphosphate pyrophosphohydrolase [Ignavibacteria bacterium]
MKEFDKFVDIVRQLRKECPWDKVQTHESLRRCLLEESYEVLEAIDNNDMDELRKELGDVLLQVVFHGIMAEETEHFNLEDVIRQETEKLIYRHPHVFGDVKVKGKEEVLINWESLKMKEGRKYILDGIPNELPALFKAYRVQEKAAKVGFDWKDPKPVYDKILEEISELKETIVNEESDNIEMEFGDVLFAIVNYARFIHVNPEDALRKTIDKFSRRFRKIEEYAEANNRKVSDMTLEEMDVIWEQSKKEI